MRELASGTQRFMPENLALTVGEGGVGGALGALAPLLMRRLGSEAIPGIAAAPVVAPRRTRVNVTAAPTAEA